MFRTQRVAVIPVFIIFNGKNLPLVLRVHLILLVGQHPIPLIHLWIIRHNFFRRRVNSGVCSADGPDANTDPDNIAYSNVITVTVHQDVVAGSIGNPQVICSGQNHGIITEVTPAGGGDGTTYTYFWQESPTGLGVGFVNAVGANTNPTYDPPVLTSTRFYRRLASSGVCFPIFSNEIQVTVNPLPTATVSGGGSACSGTAAADIVWTLTGTAPFNFTITASTPVPGFPLNVVGHMSTTFTIVAPNPAATTNFTMTALTDANTCVATSLGGPATVTVQLIPPPTVESFTGQAPVCDDGVQPIRLMLFWICCQTQLRIMRLPIA